MAFNNIDRLLFTGKKYAPFVTFWEQQMHLSPEGFRLESAIAPVTPSDGRDVHVFEIPPAIMSPIRAMVKNNDTGVFICLISAWSLLLKRYSRQSFITIDTPLYQLLPDPSSPVDSVPLVIAVQENDTYGEYLAKNQQTVRDTYQYQHYPLSLLSGDELMPLETNVMISYDAIHQTVFPADRHDLFIVMENTSDGCLIRMDYGRKSFSDTTVCKMGAQLLWILSDLTNTSRRLQTLDLLTVEEHQLIARLNTTTTSFPAGKTIIQLFEEQVTSTPDHIALVADGREVTYQQLNAAADHAANVLVQRYDLTIGDLAGILMDRSPDLIVAILAVLKTGAAYVPLEPAYPEGRIDYILEDSNCKVLLTDPANRGRVSSSFHSREVLVADLPATPLIDMHITTATAEDICYVIYTSGSTGQPKGCKLTHRNLVNYIYWGNEYYLKDCAYGNFALFTSIAFDLTLTSLFCPLTSGRKLWIFPQQEDLNNILSNCFSTSTDIDIIKLTPSHIMLLSALPISMTNIRKVIVGGEELTAQQVAVLRHIREDIIIINEYGPTEATVGCIVSNVENNAIITIGHPIANTSAYILDELFRPCPPGVPGEIFLSGINLAAGYWNREDLTNERFVPDVFRPGSRMYKTGDLGYRLENGEIVYLGRNDDQVKIRGYRIELGEVERNLLKLSAVKEAAVIVRQNKQGHKELLAYIVTTEKIPNKLLREQLGERLPAYMLPDYFLQLNSLPLTINGKIDKTKLKEPGGPTRDMEYVPPANELETSLVGIWEEVLEIERIGIKDNFFELGGNSLKATRILFRIYNVCKINVDLRTLLQHPTINALSAVISISSTAATSTIQAIPAQQNYELSPSQQRLWILEQFHDTKHLFVLPGVFILEGSLDVKLLRQALTHLINRHEILRTVIVSDNGLPRQRIMNIPEDSDIVEFINMEHHDYHTPERLHMFVQQEIATGFDLGKDLLLRCKLLELQSQQYLFVITLHHIIADEWSIGVMLSELTEIYNKLIAGQLWQLPVLPIQYKEYAHWINRQLGEGKLQEDRRYWMQQFSDGIPLLELPLDFPRPRVQTYEGSSSSMVLPAAIKEGLHLLGRRHQTSLFTIFVTVVNALLYRYTGQEDLVVGTPVNTRLAPELEGQVGFYLNNLALRTRFSGERSFDDMLLIVKEQILNAFHHQQYPFDSLINDLYVDRDISRSPLFDVMIVLQEDANEQLLHRMSGVNIHAYDPGISLTDQDLTIFIKIAQGKLELNIEYNSCLFTASKIDRMLKHLRQLLIAVIQDASIPVNQLPYLTEEEEMLLREGFNNTEADYPSDKTLQELFEVQVSKTPDAIAVCYESQSLTFAELNRRANQLANYLRVGLNIRPDDLIALIFPPSPEMIIAILGVIKAGAAYVPIDPEEVQERTQFILEDTGVRALLVANATISGRVSLKDLVTMIYEDGQWASNDPVNPILINKPSDLACILYTSGSTGTPKGVMLEHSPTVNRVYWAHRYFPLGERDVIFQKTPYVWDVSIGEIFMLCYGSRLVLCPKEVGYDPFLIVETIHRFGITTSQFVPGMYNTLLDTLTPDSISRLSSLRYVTVSGEAVLPETIRKHFDILGLPIYNIYGPTEVGEGSAYRFVKEKVLVSVGTPISNLQLYILDKYRQLVPVGVPGEIWQGGIGLARGYLHRPALTSEKYISNPFSSNEGDRIYPTGDIGRFLPDGNVVYHGRSDNQLKFRGYRIELEEIENVLLQHEQVQEAVVVAKNDVTGSQQLVAYIVQAHQSVVEDVILDQQVPADMPDITPDQRQLIDGFNSTESSFPQEKLVADIVAIWASRQPDVVCLRYEQQRWTYSMLHQQANQLARFLLKQPELVSDQPVALLLERTAYLPLSILAIWTAGAAYLPLDTASPADRICSILSDAGCQLLITDVKSCADTLKNVLPPTIKILLIEDALKTAESLLPDRPQVAVKPSQLAYVIYTSGSTGKPKGAMIEHIGMMNHLWSKVRTLKLDEHCVVAQNASQCFDISVWQFFAAMIAGGSTVIYGDEQVLAPERFLERIVRDEVTILEVVPSYLSVLLDVIETSSISWYMPALLHLLVTGETLKPALAARWFERFQGIKLVNAYGPTEVSDDITHNIMERFEPTEIIPVGRTIQNLRIYIVNESQELCQIGTIGEIWVSGIGVGRGYINDKERTASVFIEDPFFPGNRLYKTGDIGKYLPDGNIICFGRKDQQVKIRGYRIELGEIEHRLSALDGVKDSIVIAREDETGSRSLVAYICLSQPVTTLLSLQEALTMQLPEYMLPAHWVVMDQFPLTSNGKVDRRALSIAADHYKPDSGLINVLKQYLQLQLPFYMQPSAWMKLPALPHNRNGKVDRKRLPEVVWEERDKTLQYIPPANDIEWQLTSIWEEVLGRTSIGRQDNFFELGGHSLKAILVLTRIHQKLGREIPLRELFDKPTVAALSDYLSRYEKRTVRDITSIEKKAFYKTSSAQRRLHVLHQLDSSGGYNMTGAFEVGGNLDKQRFTKAIKVIVHRHEILRTRFAVLNGEVLQFVDDEFDFEPAFYEVEGEEGIVNTIGSFLRPFDLAIGHLLRVGLISVNDGRHIMLVDMHHIITDGLSIRILIEELFACYNGEDLLPLKIQYKDFAAWQWEEHNSPRLKAQQQYWKQVLGGTLSALKLPLDFARPPIQTFEGAMYSCSVPSTLAAAVRNASRLQDVTTYMFLMSAFHVLLHKYTGQEDILVGTPVSGRVHPSLERMIGMFVNTLVIRSYLIDDKTFVSVLKEVKQRTLEALENQEYPLEEILEVLDVRRDLSRNALFDVMFSLISDLSDQELQAGDFYLRPYSIPHNTAQFDLRMEVLESEQDYLISIEYNTALFKQATITRLLKHYFQLLEIVTATPEIQLKDIGVLDITERSLILDTFNDTAYPETSSAVLHHLFEEQVTRFNDRVGIMNGKEKWSYQQIDEKANQVANILHNAGIGSTAIVAIVMERSAEMISVIFGILKAGAAYLPIDISLPPGRVQYMLTDADVQAVVTHKGLFQADYFQSPVIEVDTLILKDVDKRSPGVSTDPDSIAYVMYTSGSTGLPKGVLLSHRSIVNILNCLHEKYPMTDTGRYLMKTSYAFDVSVTEIFGWMMGGGTLVIMDPGDEKDAQTILKYIRRHAITHINFVPSMLGYFLEMVSPSDRYMLKSLRYIFSGGETLPRAMADKCRELLPDVQLENLYGPTEAAIFATAYSLTQDGGEHQIPIGKPLYNVKAYVLDRHGSLQPIGVIGELYLGGICVAKGYLNRPELTAEKFIPDPFTPGGLLYRTGDLARWLPDGNLAYMGRMDHQVKIRGYRIELGEIDNVLRMHPQVKEGAAVLHEHKDGDRYIIAAYVALQPLQDSVIRKYLEEHLPSYMMPSMIVQIDELPLNSNGKVDHKRLVAILNTAQHTGDAQIAARDETDQQMIRIWEQVLDRSPIGINDNFFQIGGHSLKAIVVLSAIQETFGRKLSLRQLFLSPTIRDLTIHLQRAEESTQRRIESVPLRPYYPLSSAQRRLYILNELNRDSTNYNIFDAFSIQGHIDKQRLLTTFRALMGRHESLRTAFRMIRNQVVQVISNDAILDFTDYGSCAAEEVDTIVARFVRPYDLTVAPLFRVGLIQTAVEHYVLLLDIHHIVADGISLGILAEEFFLLYGGDVLPPPGLQYKDYASWQQAQVEKAVYLDQEAYWLEHLGGTLPLMELPTDFDRPVMQDFAGEMLHLTLDQTLSDQVKVMAERTGTTLYIFLMAAYNVLLHKYTGQDDLLIGSPVSGRSHPDTEKIVGMFVNTLVMRNQVDKNMPFVHFLELVRHTTLQAISHQDFPFDELVDKVDFHKDFSRNAVFDVAFAFQPSANFVANRLGNASLTNYPLGHHTSKFDLFFNLYEAGNALGISVEYASGLFKRDTVQAMTAHFIAILTAVTQDIHLLIRDIPVPFQAALVQSKPLNKADLRRQSNQALTDTAASRSSEMDIALARIWEELLQIDTIGIRDNFFDNGGHSMKALSLISRINRLTGLQIPLTAVYAHPTILELSDYITGLRQSRQEQEWIIPLNSYKGHPVFYFPSVIGTPVDFAQIAPGLTRHTVYGCSFIDSPDNISQYAEKLQTIQPEGAFVLIGYSAGGTLALEVAIALQESGRRVDEIILIDAYLKSPYQQLTAVEIEEEARMIMEDEQVSLLDYLSVEVLHTTLKAYIKFLQQPRKKAVIEGNIRIILSQTSRSDDFMEWQAYTGGAFELLKGIGLHWEMLSGENAGANTALINNMLKTIPIENK